MFPSILELSFVPSFLHSYYFSKSDTIQLHLFPFLGHNPPRFLYSVHYNEVRFPTVQLFVLFKKDFIPNYSKLLFPSPPSFSLATDLADAR